MHITRRPLKKVGSARKFVCAQHLLAFYILTRVDIIDAARKVSISQADLDTHTNAGPAAGNVHTGNASLGQAERDIISRYHHEAACYSYHQRLCHFELIAQRHFTNLIGQTFLLPDALS